MKFITTLMAMLLISSGIMAAITFPSLMGDNMVLQRNSAPRIWGACDPKQSITVTASWDGKKYRTVSDENGDWLVSVNTGEQPGVHTVTVESGKARVVLKNILLGDVWVCSGQSNMEHQLSGMMNQPVENSNDIVLSGLSTSVRMFTVRRAFDVREHSDCEGAWMENNSKNAYAFSAIGYVFATNVSRHTGIPVGIICSAYGGAPIEPFMSEQAAVKFPEQIKIRKDADITKETSPNFLPVSLYNAMIRPLFNYKIKGIIFYQGESNNIYNNRIYAQTFAETVRSWREGWGSDRIPFYYVQIAPWNYDDPQGTNGALLREQQLIALDAIPNSEMVTAMDIGEEDIIHPARKEIIGKRLSYVALSRDYGFEDIGFRAPVYRSMKVTDDGKVELFFDHAQLHNIYANRFLVLSRTDSDCFEVAGEDRVFYPAKAQLIPGKELTVWSERVTKPVAVRYCFRNYTTGVLYNGYGLPASSFRTDNWEIEIK